MSKSAEILTRKAPRKRDVRPLAIGGLLLLVVLVTWMVSWTPGRESPSIQSPAVEKHHDYQPFDRRNLSVSSSEEVTWRAPEALVDPHQNPEGHMLQAARQEAQARFQQAVVMLHANRFDEAVIALDRVLELLPDNADALVNKGYALLGLQAYGAAFDAFDRATDINPAQANGYYGAAMALEGMGNLQAALSGMRSFLHLTDEGPGQIHVARARAAIWEWEAKLGRGPWGPTKGIPPGFSEDELERDGKGVGIKIPRPETMDENGIMEYEIRAVDKVELFDR